MKPDSKSKINLPTALRDLLLSILSVFAFVMLASRFIATPGTIKLGNYLTTFSLTGLLVLHCLGSTNTVGRVFAFLKDFVHKSVLERVVSIFVWSVIFAMMYSFAFREIVFGGFWLYPETSGKQTTEKLEISGWDYEITGRGSLFHGILYQRCSRPLTYGHSESSMGPVTFCSRGTTIKFAKPGNQIIVSGKSTSFGMSVASYSLVDRGPHSKLSPEEILAYRELSRWWCVKRS